MESHHPRIHGWSHRSPELSLRSVSPASHPEDSSLTRTTILVVEDDESIRELVGAALRFRGFLVIEASRGDEAVELVRAARPDLIVLDVMLPGGDGFAVFHALQADGERVPVIFLTARDDLVEQWAGTVGADYLSKPFSVEELVQRIEVVLRRKSLGCCDTPQ